MQDLEQAIARLKTYRERDRQMPKEVEEALGRLAPNKERDTRPHYAHKTSPEERFIPPTVVSGIATFGLTCILPAYFNRAGEPELMYASFTAGALTWLIYAYTGIRALNQGRPLKDICSSKNPE